MDLRDIENWGRELLQNEARKRGTKNPELYSRAELIGLILRHDYGTPRNVREAARLIGGLLDSAKGALRSRLTGEALPQPRWTPPKAGSGRRDAQPPAAPDLRRETPQRRDAEPAPADPESHARIKPPEAAEPARARARARRDRQSEIPERTSLTEVLREESDESASQTPDVKSEPPTRESGEFARESGEFRLKAEVSGASDSDAQPEPEPASSRIADAEDVKADAQATATNDLTQTLTILKSSVERAAAEAAETAPDVAALPAEPLPDAGEHLLYGPHPEHGLLLRWRVSAEAIERARVVLGSDGELAVRIVTVRVDPRAVVHTDVLDHGPIADAGDWTAPLVPSAARYVSAIGLRTPARFVSIVHASI